MAFFTLIGASKFITLVFASFLHSRKLKLCSLPFSSKTRKLPALTRPFCPDERGTYSNRVASIGFLKVTVKSEPRLSTPQGVCHIVFGFSSKAKYGFPSVGSSGWYTALNSSISDQSGATRLTLRALFAVFTASISALASSTLISSSTSNSAATASL